MDGMPFTPTPENGETTLQCEDCDTEHSRESNCPRAWCSDCHDYHERDVWGDIACPGWYCADCDDNHDYGDDCPRPYCEDCGQHHAIGECEHCYCAAPAQTFTVPNDGQPPLGSGERAMVHLAAGVISEAGLREIRYYLQRIARRYDDLRLLDLSYGLDELGSNWQGKHGNYTKRLSHLAYSKHGAKIEPQVLSAVGNIARAHSTAADVEIDVTRDLNKPAHFFYHDDSCWWGGYSESRCALKSNGGFGLRSFGPDGGISGRAWVMPLRRLNGSLVPTFDTASPDALVVFNGYGDLSGYAAARVMAAMYGWTYTKISFSCDPMYVNAGGYLVGPETSLDGTKSLHLRVSRHADTYEKELAHAA